MVGAYTLRDAQKCLILKSGFANIYDNKSSFENLMNKINKNEKYLQRDGTYTYMEAKM